MINTRRGIWIRRNKGDGVADPCPNSPRDFDGQHIHTDIADDWTRHPTKLKGN